MREIFVASIGAIRTNDFTASPESHIVSPGHAPAPSGRSLRSGGCVKLFITALLFASATWAQEVAQISGFVTDQSGGLVADAEISATHGETGAKRSVISDATGFFILPSLPLGPYRV